MNEPLTSNILYDDDFISITNSGITIKWYYFPLASNLKIRWEEIESVNLETSFIRLKSWGMGLSMTWWACDIARGFRRIHSDSNIKYISLHLKDSICHKGFTVSDGNNVLAIINDYIDNAVVENA